MLPLLCIISFTCGIHHNLKCTSGPAVSQEGILCCSRADELQGPDGEIQQEKSNQLIHRASKHLHVHWGGGETWLHKFATHQKKPSFFQLNKIYIYCKQRKGWERLFCMCLHRAPSQAPPREVLTMLLSEKSNHLHRIARISQPGLQVASLAHEQAPGQGKHTRC